MASEHLRYIGHEHGDHPFGGLVHIITLIVLVVIALLTIMFIEASIGWWLIILIAVGVLVFLVFAIRAVVRTQRQQQPTGIDGLIGTTATVKTALHPKGTVATHGELWEAILDGGEAEVGEEVIITEVIGLRLRVTKKK